MKPRIVVDTQSAVPKGFQFGFFAPYYADIRAWTTEVVPWCEERFERDDWLRLYEVIWFKHPNHAMEFKLRWL